MVGFPNATSGSYTAFFDLTNAASWNSAFITAHGGTTTTAFAALLSGLNGNAYLNIHNATYPGGEISAQLHAVPEPSTWAMMLLGFGGIGLAMRRSRRNMGLVHSA